MSSRNNIPMTAIRTDISCVARLWQTCSAACSLKQWRLGPWAGGGLRLLLGWSSTIKKRDFFCGISWEIHLLVSEHSYSAIATFSRELIQISGPLENFCHGYVELPDGTHKREISEEHIDDQPFWRYPTCRQSPSPSFTIFCGEDCNLQMISLRTPKSSEDQEIHRWFWHP